LDISSAKLTKVNPSLWGYANDFIQPLWGVGRGGVRSLWLMNFTLNWPQLTLCLLPYMVTKYLIGY